MGNDTRRPRILVVDDDSLSADAAKTFLQDDYDVSTASTAEDAIMACQAEPPDLVLMDLMMPASSTFEGDEAIRRLTRDQRTAKIPIIIYTGFTGGRVLNLMALGPNVVGVLVKPLELNQMRKMIREALSRGTAAKA